MKSARPAADEDPSLRPASPKELVHLGRAAEAIGVLIVCRYLTIRDEWKTECGSGVLVRFAERDFVLTAGHVIEGRKPSEITVHFPRKNLTIIRQPGESIRNVCWSHEPDVGFIELDPSDVVFWRHMHAVDKDALLDWNDVGADERVAVIGLPTELQAKDYALDYVGAGGLIVNTIIQSGVRHAHDETGDRGFYVFYKRLQDSYNDRKHRIEPGGLSGGPIVAFERERTPLIGIVRSSVHDRHLWCEPIRFAIELLLNHEDERVVEEVREVLARLTA